MRGAGAIRCFVNAGWQSQPTVKSYLICSFRQIINYSEVSTWVIPFSPLAAVTTACQDCYHGDGKTLIISPQHCSDSQAQSGIFFISPGHVGDATSSVSSFNKGCSCNQGIFFFFLNFKDLTSSLSSTCNLLPTTLGHLLGSRPTHTRISCLILQSEAVLIDMSTRNQCEWSLLIRICRSVAGAR